MQPVFAYSFVSALLLSVGAIAQDTTILVPPKVSPPTKVGEPADVSGLFDQLEFWGNLANMKTQFQKMDVAREKIAEKIPKNSKEQYDIVVQGKEFVGFVKKGEDILAGGGTAPTRLATTEIVGTAPTKAELEARSELARKDKEAKTAAERLRVEQAKKAEDDRRRREKADRETAMDRDTHRIRSEVERFKKAGGNYRAPGM